MKQLNSKLISASMNYVNLVGNGFLKMEYRPEDEELIIKYMKITATPRRCVNTEGVLRIVGECFRVSGSNKSFVNYINKKLDSN